MLVGVGDVLVHNRFLPYTTIHVLYGCTIPHFHATLVVYREKLLCMDQLPYNIPINGSTLIIFAFMLI